MFEIDVANRLRPSKEEGWPNQFRFGLRLLTAEGNTLRAVARLLLSAGKLAERRKGRGGLEIVSGGGAGQYQLLVDVVDEVERDWFWNVVLRR